jgi:hypothetical protein
MGTWGHASGGSHRGHGQCDSPSGQRSDRIVLSGPGLHWFGELFECDICGKSDELHTFSYRDDSSSRTARFAQLVSASMAMRTVLKSCTTDTERRQLSDENMSGAWIPAVLRKDSYATMIRRASPGDNWSTISRRHLLEVIAMCPDNWRHP